MRPVLMIENLDNLHDARYCAAVGISMASFEMDPQAQNALSTKAVQEISEWLSGLDRVGKFGAATGDEIAALAAAANVNFVQLPLSFDLDHAAALPMGLIFEVPSLAAEAATTSRILEILTHFPDALILMGAAALESGILERINNGHAQLIDRLILRYDDPNPIYVWLRSKGMQPFGFALGSFATDASGIVDYDACDQFVEKVEELLAVQ